MLVSLYGGCFENVLRIVLVCLAHTATRKSRGVVNSVACAYLWRNRNAAAIDHCKKNCFHYYYYHCYYYHVVLALVQVLVLLLLLPVLL